MMLKKGLERGPRETLALGTRAEIRRRDHLIPAAGIPQCLRQNDSYSGV